MSVARDFAGYSMGEADTIRKAVSKKNAEQLAKHKAKFRRPVVPGDQLVPAIKKAITKHGGKDIHEIHVKADRRVIVSPWQRREGRRAATRLGGESTGRASQGSGVFRRLRSTRHRQSA